MTYQTSCMFYFPSSPVQENHPRQIGTMIDSALTRWTDWRRRAQFIYRNCVSIIEMNNSVVRALSIVEMLKRLGRPAPLKDIAKATNLNKATTYRLLRSLCASGLVQNVQDSGSYALGPACLTYAEGFKKSFTMRDRVLPYLERLVMVTAETGIYCERYGFGSCVTVERWDSPHDTRTLSRTDINRPLTVGP